jgi:hypothetical protein
VTVSGVTYRYEFGASIDQDGLNAISAGLRLARPDLFSHSATIVVKPADPGQPASTAHSLTIYAVVTSPLAFALYPVAGAPSLPQDSMTVEADISFSLTDNLLGQITRIKVVAQATAVVDETNNLVTIELISFELTDIEGDQPPPALGDPPRDPSHVMPIAQSLADRLAGDPLGDSFRAIIRYLVELYLKSTLESAITSFPIPTLNDLIGFGGLGTVPISGLFIRNNAFYLTAGNDLGAPSTFPAAPARPADLRIGVSQAGLRRAIDAFLPMPVPIDAGPGWLHLTGGLDIPDIEVTLPPGSGGISSKIHLGGSLNLHVEVPRPILGGTFSFDIPFPLDTLTQYDGRLYPVVSVDPYPQVPDGKVTIQLAPDVSFLGDWVAFIVTDYRDYLAAAFRQKVQDLANELLGNSFCNIPILGWIVCGTIDVAADVLGYLLGAVIDFFISSVLTVLVNALGRVLFLFLQSPKFDVLKLSQADFYNAAGVSLASALVEIVENGRDGDLQLSAWIEDQGLPIPAPPAPVNPLPGPQPTPVPPYPDAPELPEYGAAAFIPALQLPLPAWQDGVTQAFDVTIDSVQHAAIGATASATFSLERLAAGWRLSLAVSDPSGVKLTDSVAEYDAQNVAPTRLQRVSYGPKSANGSQTVTRQVVDCTTPGEAATSFGVDGSTSLQQTIPTRQGVPLEFEDFWPFRFAYAPLVLGMAAKCGVIAVADPRSASNWTREIPMTFTLAEGAVAAGADASADAAPTPVWIVTVAEEGKATTATIAKDGTGLLKLAIVTDEATITLVRH